MDKLARDLATAVEYDLILLDVQIPKLDGISLCRQLRSQGYGKSILMLTGNYSDADVVALFDAKADDYITKPCTSEVLRARMRTLLRRIWSVMPSNSRLPFHNSSECPKPDRLCAVPS
jgi:DNA-binding response OmpR family regulator